MIKKIKCHVKKKKYVLSPEAKLTITNNETGNSIICKVTNLPCSGCAPCCEHRKEYNPYPKYRSDGIPTLDWIIWQAEHKLPMD